MIRITEKQFFKEAEMCQMAKNRICILMSCLCFLLIVAITSPSLLRAENCLKRDAFETEEDFQKRCKKSSELQSKMPRSTEQGGRIDFSSIINLKKSPFETDEAFQQRRTKLIDGYNTSVNKRDPRYQAGAGYLLKDEYDIKTGSFPLKIEWQDWAANLFVVDKGYIQIQRDDAKALWEDSQQKSLPVFVTIELINNVFTAGRSFLIGLNRNWEVSLGVSSLNPAQMLNPVKDNFETEQQFQARKKKLTDSYNQAVKQLDPRFQAGVARLNKENYNESSEEFRLFIEWSEWASAVFDLLSENSVQVKRDNAIKLYREGVQKSVFIEINIDQNGKIEIKPVMIGIGGNFPLVSLKTNTEKIEDARKIERVKEETEIVRKKYEELERKCNNGDQNACKACARAWIDLSDEKR